MKRLYKSTRDRKVMGVCGGLGEYLGIDPTFLRLVWFVLIWPGWGHLSSFIWSWGLFCQVTIRLRMALPIALAAANRKETAIANRLTGQERNSTTSYAAIKKAQQVAMLRQSLSDVM